MHASRYEVKELSRQNENLRGRRGVERFCVFKKLDKTNNEQESMHKILNFLSKHRQPYPRQFIVFDGDDDGENEEQSSGGVKVAGDEENVISTVINLRIDIEDIEKLFDADLEGKVTEKSCPY
ncbi:hypothetical protein QAD02_021763 [Eretmocerus hayati]|uniref:Uncharacterized protein n=1 Tax=Eretmocerus hayati TaxID=131215 RepID=A0ACC2PRD7_9HYME|nr:hypothetical protein QAD02_021763 [Eretmocerus hayati]